MIADETPLLVIHDAGDPDAGQPWVEAFQAAGWPGPVHAPDLPGHGATPAPIGGNYDIADAVFALLPLLQRLESGPAPVVLGIGVNGWAAQLIAVAGRASALVLVDGLGGPWADGAQLIEAQRDRMRAIAADPDALAPAPRTGLDPRLRHGVPGVRIRATVEQVLTELPVPLVVVETPMSPLHADPEDRADLLAKAEPTPTTISLDERDATAVATSVTRALSAVASVRGPARSAPGR